MWLFLRLYWRSLRRWRRLWRLWRLWRRLGKQACSCSLHPSDLRCNLQLHVRGQILQLLLSWHEVRLLLQQLLQVLQVLLPWVNLLPLHTRLGLHLCDL